MAMQIQNILKNTLKVISNGRREMSSSVFSGLDNSTNANDKKKNANEFHVSARNEYPQAEIMPLPLNIDQNESTRFSPLRARDISGSIMLHQSQNYTIDVTLDNTITSDPHVSSYDCNGAVSLNSVMQSNVPTPFGGMHKFSHLNMPGGQWEQSSKFMANDLHSSHYTNLRREVRMDWNNTEHDVTKSSDKKKVD